MTDKDLVYLIAKALRDSGRTCDEDTWPEVMAAEALKTLRRLDRIKKGADE